MDINVLISRLDEEALQNILGKEVLQTLGLLKKSYLYPQSLSNILRNTYSNQTLLLERKTRNCLIDVLKKNEITSLLFSLEIESFINPYELLKNLPFKGKDLNNLFLFFEERLNVEVQQEIVYEKEINVNYPLYTYQRNVLNKIEHFLNGDKRRVLLHMPTGSGKTRTAMTYICRFLVKNENLNVIWFANTKELLDQAFDEFEIAWASLGDRTINTLKFWGKSNIDLSKLKGSFIVAGLDKTYQSLMKNVGAMSTFSSNTGLVIMDEAHMAIAPTYKLLIENLILNNALLIGLSATPGRTWNNPDEDKKLSNFFYGQKAKLDIQGYDNPVNYLVDEGYLAKVNNVKLFCNTGIKLSEEDLKYLTKNLTLPLSILNQVSENKLRNLAIVSKVNELVKVHKRIILFAITKQHAIILNRLLTAIGLNSSVITSDTDSNERMSIIKVFKVPRVINSNSLIICNYGILTTGFDAPEISCAIISRPTESLVLYSQMVGRAIRGPKSGGNKFAEIITVIDEELPGFKEVADAFFNWEDIWVN